MCECESEWATCDELATCPGYKPWLSQNACFQPPPCKGQAVIDNGWKLNKSASCGIYPASPLIDLSSCDCWTLLQDRKKHLLFKSEALWPNVDIYHWCLRYFDFHFHCIFPGNNTVWHCEKNIDQKQHWYSLKVASPRGDFNLLRAVNIQNGLLLWI